MAVKKISELNSIDTIADTDVMPIVDVSETETKKISGSQIKTYSQGDLPTKLAQKTNYNATTEDGTGKIKCTLTGTLASGDIVNVTIPTLANTSATMQLSVDNGVTYYYIKQLSADTVFTDYTNAEITNSKCSLYFDGTYFILNNSKYGGKLIANLNTIIKDDEYTCYTGATGLSTEMNALGVSFHIHHQNSNVGVGGAYQKAVAFSTDLIIYERTKVNGTWGNWINKSTINNLTTATAGNGILDAYQGKVLNDKINSLPNIEYGRVPFSNFDDITVGAKASKKKDILFSKVYSNIPSVVLTYDNENLEFYGNIICFVSNLTLTGFNIIAFDINQNLSGIYFNYQVIGK